MPINVAKTYKFGDKKKTILQFMHGEITQTKAAAKFGVTRQNFPNIISTVVRQMVKEDEAFNKAFHEAFRKYNN